MRCVVHTDRDVSANTRVRTTTHTPTHINMHTTPPSTHTQSPVNTHTVNTYTQRSFGGGVPVPAKRAAAHRRAGLPQGSGGSRGRLWVHRRADQGTVARESVDSVGKTCLWRVAACGLARRSRLLVRHQPFLPPVRRRHRHAIS